MADRKYYHWECTSCEKRCEPVEKDMGNYEECWGAKVWRSDFAVLSDCCNEDCIEVEDGD